MILVMVAMAKMARSATEPDIDLERYHSYEELTQLFKNLETQYPNLAKSESIGQSVEHRELLVLHITDSVKVIIAGCIFTFHTFIWIIVGFD